MLLYDARKLKDPFRQLDLGTGQAVTCLHFQHSATRLQAAARQRAAKSAKQPVLGAEHYATPSQVLALRVLTCTVNMLGKASRLALKGFPGVAYSHAQCMLWQSRPVYHSFEDQTGAKGN